jgi:D-glycero-D-manno-heptose 1,7-bisphosphate phosphatase
VPDRAVLSRLVADRVGRDWCLFLDRDGVVNRRVRGDYVRSWPEFSFLPGALEALAQLAAWAPRVAVVTNQQGVARGLMTADDLDGIHARMTAEVAAAGGRLDAVLACSHAAAAGCPCRKPRPGLAAAWLADHPSVDTRLSVMVGDQPSDLEMARRLGGATGGCTSVAVSLPGAEADLHCASLAHLAAGLADLDPFAGRTPPAPRSTS